MGHFEEEQVGELLDVVAVGHAVVAQDVAVVPEFLDDVLGFGGHKKRCSVTIVTLDSLVETGSVLLMSCCYCIRFGLLLQAFRTPE